MIVVIDGYNLLRSVFPKVKGKLDKQRKELISQLGFYKKKRSGKIKELVLVFDGGFESRATREIKHGVTVIFSGRKRSADQWIIDFVERKKGREIMLVTRDREIIEKCKGKNVEVIKVLDFYNIMQDRLLEEVEHDMTVSSQSGIEKYKNVEESVRSRSHSDVIDIQSEALDILMRQANLDEYQKSDDFFEDEKKGQSKPLSKKKKKRRARLKKL